MIKIKKSLATLICFSIIFSSVVPSTLFIAVPEAQAAIIPVNFVPDVGTVGTTAGTLVGVLEQILQALLEYAAEIAAELSKSLASAAVVLAKIVALYAVQEAVALLLGDDSGGSNLIIRDFGEYLYKLPKKAAAKQMKAFFSQLSGGRTSYSSYEGVGTSYISQVKKQGETAMDDLFEGTVNGKKIATNLQEYVSDTTDGFSSGNLKGLVASTICGNSQACVNSKVMAFAADNAQKGQETNKAEANNGMLPQKSSTGRITTPAVMAWNALVDIDKHGSNLILNANAGAGNAASILTALEEIAAGAAMSIVSRAINYGIVDKAAKAEEEVISKGYTFSTSYGS